MRESDTEVKTQLEQPLRAAHLARRPESPLISGGKPVPGAEIQIFGKVDLIRFMLI
ncbi:MAG: hypothetical protein WD851_05375 [Pirellulales bacterium]